MPGSLLTLGVTLGGVVPGVDLRGTGGSRDHSDENSEGQSREGFHTNGIQMWVRWPPQAGAVPDRTV